MTGELLTSALSLAKRGFRVFPLKVKGWTPAHKGWQQEATTDLLSIMETWSDADYNIGVATGNGLLVVDVDDKPGKNGSASLDAFKLNGATYDTFTVKTPTGGRHLYYRAGDIGNTAGRLGPDLDVRSLGGYVVGPGSVLDPGTKNATGGRYELVQDFEPREVPAPFMDRLISGSVRLAEAAVELDTLDALKRAANYLIGAPVAIEGSAGDHTTFTIAAKVKDFGISEHVALDLLTSYWNPRCRPPWDAEDLKTKVANAFAYGKNAPGIDHPAHTFEGVHIDPVRPRDALWFRHGDPWQGSVQWLYKGLLPTTGVCILTGPTQSGKTFVGLHLAKSITTGDDFFGVHPKVKGAVIYLVGEAYGSVKQRMAGLGSNPLPISATYVGALAARGAWGELCANIVKEAEAIKDAYDLPTRLIILDTLSASGILEDEDNNALAATVMRLFADLSVAMNALFVVLHHPPKSGQGTRGAGAIINNADYALEVEREGVKPVRNLRMVKSRDAEQGSIGSFTLVPVEIGKDEEGEAVVTMKVSTGAPVELRYAAKTPAHAEKAFEAIEHSTVEHGEVLLGDRVVEYRYAYERFKEGFDSDKSESVRSKTFTAAINFMEASGSIEVVEIYKRKYIKIKELGS